MDQPSSEWSQPLEFSISWDPDELRRQTASTTSSRYARHPPLWPLRGAPHHRPQNHRVSFSGSRALGGNLWRPDRGHLRRSRNLVRIDLDAKEGTAGARVGRIVHTR